MSEPFILSIRQPWAWLIINAGKDIENRDWYTKVRGKILIHAGKGMTRAEYEYANSFYSMTFPEGVAMPSFDDLQRGGIIGEAEIVDCVSHSLSPWFFGKFGFVLKNQKPLPFEPCKGQLGFFRRDP